MIKAKNRRLFLKEFSLLAAAPLLAKGVFAFDKAELKNENPHRILCCNIRVALAEDEEKGMGWSKRKDLCMEVIKSQNPDIICLQEVLRIQNEDLKAAVPHFFSFGFEGPEMDTGDNDYHGIAKNPIFFSKKRYELLSAGGYWLSETPLIAGSISWESSRARNANWVRIKDKKSGKEFRVVNLHLDHKVQAAKEQQIELALKEAKQYSPNFQQILTGDLNSTIANPVNGKIKSYGWQDTYEAVHGEKEAGITMHGFKGDAYPVKPQSGRIDFIFSKGPVKSLASKIIKDHKNKLYPSDHYFMMADVRIH